MKYTSNDMQIILIHPVVSAGQGGLRSWITLYIIYLLWSLSEPALLFSAGFIFLLNAASSKEYGPGDTGYYTAHYKLLNLYTTYVQDIFY